MAELPDDATLSEVVDRFATARGVEADEHWASAAMLRLLWADVAPTEVRRALEEALLLTEQSQESPEELYGAADAWARELVRQWRAEGRLMLAPEECVGVRGVAVYGFASGAVVSVVLMVLLLVRDGATTDYTVGLLAFPVGLGMAGVAALAVRQRVLLSRPAAVATVAAVAVILAGSTVMAGTFALGNDHPVATASPWWFCLLAAACALLSVLCDRALPRHERTLLTAPLDDEEWQRSLASALRTRAGLPESRVQSIVAEARAHAGDSGRSLEQEFGRPESYAARFGPDLATMSRRSAWMFAALAVPSALLTVDDFAWSGLAVTAILGGWAVREARRARRRSAPFEGDASR